MTEKTLNRVPIGKIARLGIQAAVNAHALAKQIEADAQRLADNMTRRPRKQAATCAEDLNAIAREAIGLLDIPKGAASELEIVDGVFTGFVTWSVPLPVDPEVDPSLLEVETPVVPPDPLAAFENEGDPASFGNGTEKPEKAEALA